MHTKEEALKVISKACDESKDRKELCHKIYDVLRATKGRDWWHWKYYNSGFFGGLEVVGKPGHRLVYGYSYYLDAYATWHTVWLSVEPDGFPDWLWEKIGNVPLPKAEEAGEYHYGWPVGRYRGVIGEGDDDVDLYIDLE